MNSRDITHLPHAGITIGVYVSDGTAKIAIAFCNSTESFSRKGGRHVLDLRFDAADAILSSFNMRRNLLTIDYDGVQPRKDILFPIADIVRDELKYERFIDIEEDGSEGPPIYYPPGTEYDDGDNTFIIPMERVQRSVNKIQRVVREFVKERCCAPKTKSNNDHIFLAVL